MHTGQIVGGSAALAFELVKACGWGVGPGVPASKKEQGRDSEDTGEGEGEEEEIERVAGLLRAAAGGDAAFPEMFARYARAANGARGILYFFSLFITLQPRVE